jgi:hypothetical protein
MPPKKPLLLALLLAAACGEGPRTEPAPLDRFTFPTALAIVPAPGAPGGRALVVVSSNFDLRYGQADGGSVLAINPDTSTEARLDVLPEGKVRIASFGGEMGVASAATCPGLAGDTRIVVASRSENALFGVTMDGAGKLSCGAGCRTPLATNVGDPYGLAVVCRVGAAPTAYVGHLRAPDSTGWLSRVDLASGGLLSTDRAGDAPTSSLAYDSERQLLYVTTRFARVDRAWLRTHDLRAGEAGETDLGPALEGADLRSIALSHDGTRAFVAVRIYDPTIARDRGRPSELAARLAILDLRDGRRVLVDEVALPLGADQIVVIPREGTRRDVVAVTSSQESALTLYDDEAGAVAATISRDANGELLFGERPSGIAFEVRPGADRPATQRRLYVASFDRGFLRAVDVDLDRPADARASPSKIGPEVP